VKVRQVVYFAKGPQVFELARSLMFGEMSLEEVIQERMVLGGTVFLLHSISGD
jgi:hypothetical protein